MMLGSNPYHKVVLDHSKAHVSIEQKCQSPEHFLFDNALASCHQSPDLFCQLLVVDQSPIATKHTRVRRILKKICWWAAVQMAKVNRWQEKF
jgi:hypothetical protein